VTAATAVATAATRDTGGDGGGDGGGSETVTVEFLSANAAENGDIQDHFNSSMEDFASKNDGYEVDLQTASYGDISQALSSRPE